MASSPCPAPRRILLVCLLLGLGFQLASAGKRGKKLKKPNTRGGSKNAQEDQATAGLKAELGTVKAELITANQEKTALRQQVKTCEGETSKQANRISDLMHQLSKQEQTISKLTSELTSKQPVINEKAKLAKDVDEKTKRIAELTSQMSGQQKEIAKLTEALANVRIKYQDLNTQYDDPSLQHFLAAKAQKVYHHPGIEGAANKTFVYVLPAVEGLIQERVVTLYNSTYASIEDGLQAMVGGSDGDWIPAVSSFLVYGLFTLPFAFALTCLVEFVCRVKYILLACSFYLFCLSVGASGFVAYTHADPLNAFAEQDASVYLWSQVGFGVTFVLYFVLLIAICTLSCMQIETPLSEVVSRGLQCVALLIFGIAYYQLVWTPAMVDEMPKVEAFMAQFTKQADAKQGEEAPVALNLMLAPYLVSNAIFLTVFAIEEGIWHGAKDEKVAPEEKEDKGD